jgi:EpsD family peptidyl-prolyl cis-trans isomerase
MTIKTTVPASAAGTLLLLAIVSAGCARQDADGARAIKPAATVDGIAISQQSVMAAVPVDDDKRRKAQLDTFVAEQVLANAAVRDKLDADVAVVSALETARRQVLARAYIAKKGAALPKPTSDEIIAFYQQHPELFAQRRIFRLQEIAIAVPPERVADITARFHDLKTFNARAEWLKKTGIPFTIGVGVKAAEDIPADLLSTLTRLKDGDAFNMPSEKGLAVIQITGVESQPLTVTQAQPFIERFLRNQRLGEMINQESKRLRDSARIEYFPPYSAKAP